MALRSDVNLQLSLARSCVSATENAARVIDFNPLIYEIIDVDLQKLALVHLPARSLESPDMFSTSRPSRRAPAPFSAPVQLGLISFWTRGARLRAINFWLLGCHGTTSSDYLKLKLSARRSSMTIGVDALRCWLKAYSASTIPQLSLTSARESGASPEDSRSPSQSDLGRSLNIVRYVDGFREREDLGYAFEQRMASSRSESSPVPPPMPLRRGSLACPPPPRRRGRVCDDFAHPAHSTRTMVGIGARPAPPASRPSQFDASTHASPASIASQALDFRKAFLTPFQLNGARDLSCGPSMARATCAVSAINVSIATVHRASRQRIFLWLRRFSHQTCETTYQPTLASSDHPYSETLDFALWFIGGNSARSQNPIPTSRS